LHSYLSSFCVVRTPMEGKWRNWLGKQWSQTRPRNKEDTGKCCFHQQIGDWPCWKYLNCLWGFQYAWSNGTGRLWIQVCTAKMNLSDEVDLEDYVSRPDKISAAEVSAYLQVFHFMCHCSLHIAYMLFQGLTLWGQCLSLSHLLVFVPLSLTPFK
jgi:hypothetical protein